MKKKLLSILLVAAMAIGLTACGELDAAKDSASSESAAPAAHKITVVLDWTPNTNHTGLYVAKELGYFDEAGFDVDIVQPPEDGSAVLVASGKAQFGVSFQDHLAPCFAGDEHMPIEAVAAIMQHNTSGIISNADKGITSPKEMAGHSYATWQLDIEQAMIKDVVEKDGGDFSKVEMVPSTVTDEVSALKADSVDTIWVYSGWAGVACDLAGLDTNFISFADINPALDYYSPVLIGNTDWIGENPDANKAFVDAVARGYEYAVENPEDAAKILLKAAPELDEELVVASQMYLADQYIADASQWGVMDADRWNAFYKWINDNNILESEVRLDEGFTNEYLPKR